MLWAMLNAIKELKQQQDRELAKIWADSEARITALQQQVTALMQAVQGEPAAALDHERVLVRNP